MFVDAFQKKYGYRPEWGANNAYMQFALWADAVERAGTFYPPDVIKAYEAGNQNDSTVGEVYFRAADHQLVRPVVIVRGKKPADMKNPEDFWEVIEVVPGEPLMQAPTLSAAARLGHLKRERRSARLLSVRRASALTAGGLGRLRRLARQRFMSCGRRNNAFYYASACSPGRISSRSSSMVWRRDRSWR